MMNSELYLYMRRNPRWYVEISRNPRRIADLELQYKEDTNTTFAAKMDRLSMVLNMMEMML